MPSFLSLTWQFCLWGLDNTWFWCPLCLPLFALENASAQNTKTSLSQNCVIFPEVIWEAHLHLHPHLNGQHFKYPSLSRKPAAGYKRSIIDVKTVHLEIVRVIGRQLLPLCFVKVEVCSLPAKTLLTHTSACCTKSDCKLQLYCIPGQIVVVQHIYIASINSPRIYNPGINSPKWTSGRLAVSELCHVFIISALFVGLWLLLSWSCPGQPHILMKNMVSTAGGEVVIIWRTAQLIELKCHFLCGWRLKISIKQHVVH